MARLPAKLECPQMPLQSAEAGCRAYVEPGEELTCRLLVYNPADKVDEIRTHLGGPLAQWASVEPDRLPLMPGHEGALELWLRLPVEARIEAGEHPLLVEARSGLPDTEPAVQECLVEVGRRTDAQLSVNSAPGGRRHSSYEVVVESGSNHPLRLNLELDAAVPVEVSHQVLVIPPFDRAMAQVRVPETGLSGQQVAIAVTATGEGVELRQELTHVVHEVSEGSTRTRESPPCLSKAFALAFALTTAALFAAPQSPVASEPWVLLVAALAAVWLLFGYAGCRIMTIKGRRRRSGWALGILLGPFGLVIAAVLSDVTRRTGRT